MTLGLNCLAHASLYVWPFTPSYKQKGTIIRSLILIYTDPVTSAGGVRPRWQLNLNHLYEHAGSAAQLPTPITMELPVITEEHSIIISQPLSKKAQKRAAKAARLQEQKAERRAREKEAKKRKRRERAEAGDADPRKRRKMNIQDQIPFAAQVVIDLGFDDMMTEKVRAPVPIGMKQGMSICVGSDFINFSTCIHVQCESTLPNAVFIPPIYIPQWTHQVTLRCYKRCWTQTMDEHTMVGGGL